MSLIKCPECGNDVSNKAESCPHCGYKIEVQEEERKEIPNRVKQVAKEYEKRLSICYAIVVGLVVLLFVCVGNSDNEAIIYPFVLAFVAMYLVIKVIKANKANALGSWNDQYETEVNGKLTATVCPNCGSGDVSISINTVGETYTGKNEVRKKSAVTRGANKKSKKRHDCCYWWFMGFDTEEIRLQRGTKREDRIQSSKSLRLPKMREQLEFIRKIIKGVFRHFLIF